MSKTIKWAVWLIIIGAGFYFLLWPRLRPANKDNTAGKPAAEKRFPVETATVSFQQAEQPLLLTGTLLPYEQTDIRSEVAARLTHIHFEEGQKVAKGKLLATLDDSDWQAELKKLQYEQQLSQKLENRQKTLLERGAVSRQEYEIAQTNLNTIKARIEQTKVTIAKYRITAPFSGKVGLRNISKGSYLSPGSLITTLTADNPVKVEFTVPGRHANKVNTGRTIFFEAETSDSLLPAKVYAADQTINQDTRSLTVRALADNKNGQLIPGGFITVRLSLDTSKALVVPSPAVVSELEGRFVYVIEGGKAIKRTITTGRRMEQNVEITSGLKAGEEVVVTGTMSLKPQATVEVKGRVGL